MASAAADVQRPIHVTLPGPRYWCSGRDKRRLQARFGWQTADKRRAALQRVGNHAVQQPDPMAPIDRRVAVDLVRGPDGPGRMCLRTGRRTVQDLVEAGCLTPVGGGLVVRHLRDLSATDSAGAEGQMCRKMAIPRTTIVPQIADTMDPTPPLAAKPGGHYKGAVGSAQPAPLSDTKREASTPMPKSPVAASGTRKAPYPAPARSIASRPSAAEIDAAEQNIDDVEAKMRAQAGAWGDMLVRLRRCQSAPAAPPRPAAAPPGPSPAPAAPAPPRPPQAPPPRARERHPSALPPWHHPDHGKTLRALDELVRFNAHRIPPSCINRAAIAAEHGSYAQMREAYDAALEALQNGARLRNAGAYILGSLRRIMGRAKVADAVDRV